MKKPRKQEPKIDAINRRRRDIPNSTGARVVPNETDILRFSFIQRHGDLPLTLIHEYTKHRCKNIDATRKRFTRLFHEKNTPHVGTYIDRDPNQYKTRNSDYQFGVYRTNARSNKLLKECGLYQKNTPHTSSSWDHDFLRACYSSSVELLCLKEPDKYQYIPHHEIVDRIGKDIFEVDGKKFRPDLLHGILHKEENKAVLYMVEIDRNTEQVESTEITRKNNKVTFEDKLENYKNYFAKKLYRDDFGREGILLHTVTSNKVHMDRLIKLAARVFTGGANFTLFNYVDGFEFGFIPPSKPFPVFTTPSLRPGRADFYISDASSR